MLKHAAACLALLATTAMPASAAPYMIVGNDEKPGTDAEGKPVVNPAGNDTVVIFDLANPEEPTVVATLKLENSIVGPPTNLDIAPNGSIALVADAMTVTDDNGTRKLAPDRQAVRHRPQGQSAEARADGHRRQAAVGPVVQPEGRHGAGGQPRRRHDQRAQDRRHQRDADRHRADQPRRVARGVHARRQARARAEIAGQQGGAARHRWRQGELQQARHSHLCVPLQRGGLARFEAGDHRRQRQRRIVRRQRWMR